MALKADRYEESTDISFFYNDDVATRGGVVVLDAVLASGAAMDQGGNKVTYKTAAATDVPVGILLNDVVNKDLTRTHLNQYKDEVQKGGKVTVMTRGWVVTKQCHWLTNCRSGGLCRCSNERQCLYTCQLLLKHLETWLLAVGCPTKDADGYAKLYVNLPNHGLS